MTENYTLSDCVLEAKTKNNYYYKIKFVDNNEIFFIYKTNPEFDDIGIGSILNITYTTLKYPIDHEYSMQRKMITEYKIVKKEHQVTKSIFDDIMDILSNLTNC
jgi:hypothetical protein